MTKLRKSKDEDLRSGLILPPPTASESSSSRHYASEETQKPPLPPLPTGYKQMNYEKSAANLAMAKRHLNQQQNKHQPPSQHPPIYSANETSLEHQNRLLYQRQLSKSVGDNLQQQSKPKFSTLDGKSRLLRPLSSGDLLGKTDEELILLLIQLKRNQSQLKHTIEKLTLQMQSEDKMSMIEPHKVAEHKLKYEQVKEQLIEAQKQYENQFPLIDLIDNMVKFNSSSRSNLNNPIYGYNVGALAGHGGLTSNTVNSLSTNNVYASSTNGKDSGAARNSSTSYLNRLSEPTDDRPKRASMNDESDYAESDANNGTYTNRSSTACAQQLSETNQDLTVRDQSISNRNALEIPSASHKKPHHAKAGQQAGNSKTNSKQASEPTSSQATTTNTLSSVIASVKQMHSNANLQVNQQKSINQAAAAGGLSKSRTVLAEEEMQRMKEQQMLLEAELERVRTLLLNSQLNVPQANLDDLSIATTTENHFQAELEYIDNEINNLNAKKEKLIQSLKRKEHAGSQRAGYCNAVGSKDLEDGTDLFTDDDAIFSTANSIDFERVLDDGLSLCTDVDDLELSKHENEYVQTLQAEHEQNLKQQEEERRKLERQQHQVANERKRQESEQCKSTSSSNNNDDDEGTTETTIYKTLRLVKRKYESSKLNKQLTFDSGDILSIDNKVIEVKRAGNQSDKTEQEKHLLSADGQQSGKLKVGIFPR